MQLFISTFPIINNSVGKFLMHKTLYLFVYLHRITKNDITRQNKMVMFKTLDFQILFWKDYTSFCIISHGSLVERTLSIILRKFYLDC